MEKPEKPTPGAVIIPKEFAPRGNPFGTLPLPDGRDAHHVRFGPLYKALEPLGLAINPRMGKHELIAAYEAALLRKTGELVAEIAPHLGGAHYIDGTIIHRAAKALAGKA